MAELIEKVAEAIARGILLDIHARALQLVATVFAESAMVETLGRWALSLREARIIEINGVVTLIPSPRGGPVVAGPGEQLWPHVDTAATSGRLDLQPTARCLRGVGGAPDPDDGRREDESYRRRRWPRALAS